MAVRNFLQPLLEKRTVDPVKKRGASFLQLPSEPEQAGGGFLDELGGDDIKQKIAEAAFAETMREFGATGRVTPTVPYKEAAPSGLGEKVAKGLEYAFYPFTAVGIAGHEQEKAMLEAAGTITPEGKIRTTTLGETIEVKDWFPGGKKYEEFRQLPVTKQLAYELPAWIATSMVGGASGIRATLLPLTQQGRAIPTRIAAEFIRTGIAPIAGAEYGIGQVFRWTVGKPLEWVFGEIKGATTRAAFHKTPVYQIH